jgi:protein O-mannosyl-transferase
MYIFDGIMNFTVKNIRILIFCVVFIVFGNTLKNDFAWDDSIVITDNSKVQKGISGIPKLFIKSQSDLKEDKYGYRPITLSSFALEWSLFKKNPTPYHFNNVLLFAILCCLIFDFLMLIFAGNQLLAFISLLFFIVHPIHVEVVANIKSRDEILAFLFGLIALKKVIRYFETDKLPSLWYGILFFVLAFLSRESAIVFLGIIPVFLWMFGYIKKTTKAALTIGMVSVALLSCLLIVQLAMNSKVNSELTQGAGIFYEDGLLGNCYFYIDNFSQKLCNAFYLLAIYLKNYFYPIDLVYYYGYNVLTIPTWSNPLVIISIFFHLTLAFFAIINAKKYRVLSFFILFYFISIIIYLHLFRTLADTMADRFYFVSSLASGALLATRLFKLFRIKETTIKEALHTKAFVWRASFFGIIGFLFVLTVQRNAVWKDNKTLIFEDIEKLHFCARAHNYCANELQLELNQGNTKEKEIIKHYAYAIAITNRSYYAYVGLINYLTNRNYHLAANAMAKTFYGIFPKAGDSQFYLGKTYYMVKQPALAIPFLKQSLETAPNVLETHLFYAKALIDLKKYAEANTTLINAEIKFGSSIGITENLALCAYEAGDIDKSTNYMLALINAGADAKLIYSAIIGRYQIVKNDVKARFYYEQAKGLGLF